VVIAGGGIAGVEGLMALADLGDRRLAIELIAPRDVFVLRPQMLGEPWGGPPLRAGLADLCAEFGATFHRGTLAAVDPVAREAVTTDGLRRPYDELLVATGAVASLPHGGAHVLGFGHLPDVLAAPGDGDVAVVVPAGTTWTLPAYELALLVAGGSGRSVRVLTPERAPLEAFGEPAARAAGALLDEHGVAVELGRALPRGADASALADTVVVLPRLDGPAHAGLPHDAQGFVVVDATLAVRGLDGVHAAGDVTSGHIKQGGLAAQQADAVAARIAARSGAHLPAMPYAPVLRGKLVCPDGTELYLRRTLDGRDPGEARRTPLWRGPGVVLSRRLTAWLARRPGYEGLSLDHVADAPSSAT
jgi:sulfide:quinone oxidoreductase